MRHRRIPTTSFTRCRTLTLSQLRDSLQSTHNLLASQVSTNSRNTINTATITNNSIIHNITTTNTDLCKSIMRITCLSNSSSKFHHSTTMSKARGSLILTV